MHTIAGPPGDRIYSLRAANRTPSRQLSRRQVRSRESVGILSVYAPCCDVHARPANYDRGRPPLSGQTFEQEGSRRGRGI